jgi:hypothetical protein
MNQDKAREYFSAYHEGTLDGGLLHAFEHRLRSDALVQAEFHSFQRTMAELDRLRLEEIEVPDYLSDRIASRLEQELGSSRSKPVLSLWMPRFAVAAAVLAVVASAAVLMRGGGNSGPGVAGLSWPSEAINLQPSSSGVTLQYKSAAPKTVQILSATGTNLSSYPIEARQPLKAELRNDNAEATLFEIKVSDNGPDEYVAVEGTKTSTNRAGSGSILDFAKALSGTFHMPVVVNDPQSIATKTVTWDLAGTDAKAAAQKALDGTGYDVTLTASGMIAISG